MWLPSQSSDQQGFTLIEMIIVTGLAMILISAVVAGYNALGRMSSRRESGGEVMSALTFAQNRARSGDRPESGCTTLNGYRVWASQNSQTYTVAAMCNNDGVDREAKTYSLNQNEFFQNAFSVLYPTQPGPVSGAPVTINIGTLGSDDGAGVYSIVVSATGNVDGSSSLEEGQ